ncbi:acyl-CoA dehydrogenase family protein [Streptomyces sp. NPDC060205]|uniref:acyl-CoA dehydrogenase family protein n=1 Tax=Streptomyces sp. NPDC060205 TaxID=3347072 RepID=UPI00365260A1
MNAAHDHDQDAGAYGTGTYDADAYDARTYGTGTNDAGTNDTDAYDYRRGIQAIWPETERLLPTSVTETLAGLAERNDRAGRLSDSSVGALREAGWFGLPVPREFEGGGGSIEECCALQRRIGAADPALAIAVTMHLFSVGVLVEHWRRERDESWMLLEAIAGQQRIVGNAFAEPGLAGALTRSHCTARRTGKEWTVNGVKVPCSLAERSDLLCLQVRDEAGGPESLLVALVATDSPGITVERTWNTLGMRASESDTVRLRDCVIPDELVFHRTRPGSQGDEVFAAGLGWFCVSITACYLGLISAAVDQARAALENARITHLGASRSELPSFQSALGALLVEVLPLEAACAGLARQLDARTADPRSLIPALLALKCRAAELATRAVEAASELVGVASYAATGTASRLLRDAHAARFHPPTRFATRQLLGRWALGLPFTFELDERPGFAGDERHSARPDERPGLRRNERYSARPDERPGPGRNERHSAGPGERPGPGRSQRAVGEAP